MVDVFCCCASCFCTSNSIKVLTLSQSLVLTEIVYTSVIQWSNCQQSNSQTMNSSQIRAAKQSVTLEVIKDTSSDFFTSLKSTICCYFKP